MIFEVIFLKNKNFIWKNSTHVHFNSVYSGLEDKATSSFLYLVGTVFGRWSRPNKYFLNY